MSRVAVHQTVARYPESPFNPSKRYPEYPYEEVELDTNKMYRIDPNILMHTNNSNNVYEGVRTLFRNLGFDKKNFGKKNWNPLGELIRPGDRVVIKPNFVLDVPNDDRLMATVTHPSVLRPIVDYAHIAGGLITIADSPIEDTRLEEIARRTGLNLMVAAVNTRGAKVRVVDIRAEVFRSKTFIDFLGFKLRVEYVKKVAGDPEGYFKVDLKDESELRGIGGNLRSIHKLRDHTTTEHFDTGKAEYQFGGTILKSDVIINVPKMKTHRKAGVTLSLKNVVGTIGKKEWLPHYREGGPSVGDESHEEINKKRRIFDYLTNIPLLKKYGITVRLPFISGIVRKALIGDAVDIGSWYQSSDKVVRRGDWYGNDTTWRMVVDLNKCLLYANKEGKLQSKKQREYLTVIDGIIAGEGHGPLRPIPKKAGFLIASEDPVAADAVAAQLMGLDPKKIKTIVGASKQSKYRIGEMRATVVGRAKAQKFKLPEGWEGHLEREH